MNTGRQQPPPASEDPTASASVDGAEAPVPAPLDRGVFFSATAVLAAMILTTIAAPEFSERLFQGVLGTIIENGSWYYVLVVAIVLLSVTFVAVSSYGDIKLGPDHAEPDYGYLSWFAMLFAAGMGIGLMFFGVAEPVMHFLSPPQGAPGTVPAAREAMTLTFFHWGLHAWAIYAIVALVLGYFAYRHGQPLTLRSALYPVIGDRVYGPIGTAVDVFAILSTTFGVATSLGLGVDQINSGLNYLFDVPKTVTVQMLLIFATTALATVSVVAGLDAGIKRLSEINIVLAIALLLLVLLLGPTVLLLQSFMQNTGDYLSVLVGKTFNLYAYEPTDWLGGWTIFYWGWWISWAPFVGLFIARISKGRTLREFVLGAMLVPALFTLLWMTVFGNTAIDLILNQGHATLGDAVQADESVALFRFFEYFPFTDLLAGLAIFMVLVFFVTSADSGAMVLNMLSSHGRDDTPNSRRVIWMAIIGVTAAVLLLAGGLSALQTAAIAGALPFSVVLLFAIWGFRRALQVDHAKRHALSLTALTPSAFGGTSHWRDRLENLLDYASDDDVATFQQNVALPALKRFAQELSRRGIDVTVTDDRKASRTIRLVVSHGDEPDFVYAVVNAAHPLPDAALIGRALADLAESETYHRAEVHLSEGSQDYNLMGWTQDHIANDVLEQYERHLHFLHLVR